MKTHLQREVFEKSAADKEKMAVEATKAGPQRTASASAEKINVVEAMLAEVPALSEEARERVRKLFPDGKVCCPIKVARAIQLELLRENDKGQIRFTA